MKTIRHHSCQGYCPNCLGENLEYGSVTVCGQILSYPVHCKDCNQDFREIYDALYIETEWEK